LLIVGGPEQRDQGARADERHHGAPLSGIEPFLLLRDRPAA
jgi:hypothetical protein